MSLKIEVSKVQAVMLGDRWHEVVPGTFDLDAYEYVEGGSTIHGGGSAGVVSTGFHFFEDKDERFRISGPITAIQAVRTKEKE